MTTTFRVGDQVRNAHADETATVTRVGRDYLIVRLANGLPNKWQRSTTTHTVEIREGN